METGLAGWAERSRTCKPPRSHRPTCGRDDCMAGVRGFELANVESQRLPSHGARPEPTGKRVNSRHTRSPVRPQRVVKMTFASSNPLTPARQWRLCRLSRIGAMRTADCVATRQPFGSDRADGDKSQAQSAEWQMTNLHFADWC
jgi:hypothetical protein